VLGVEKCMVAAAPRSDRLGRAVLWYGDYEYPIEGLWEVEGGAQM
jgi:hypothetical protein